MCDDLHNLIRKHEGFRASAYRDARRDLTIDCACWIDARLGNNTTRQGLEFMLAGETKPVKATVFGLCHRADGFTALDVTRSRP